MKLLSLNEFNESISLSQAKEYTKLNVEQFNIEDIKLISNIKGKITV